MQYYNFQKSGIKTAHWKSREQSPTVFLSPETNCFSSHSHQLTLTPTPFSLTNVPFYTLSPHQIFTSYTASQQFFCSSLPKCPFFYLSPSTVLSPSSSSSSVNVQIQTHRQKKSSILPSSVFTFSPPRFESLGISRFLCGFLISDWNLILS